METEVANLFAEQVSLGMLVQNLVYASGTVGAIFVVIGLMLIDVGGVRRRNIFNATIEKMVGFFIGFTAYFLIGFAFWASQYYIMVDYTLVDTIKDWWAGGGLSNSMAQNVDPAVFPGLNNFQIFIFFLACFAGIVNVLLHFAVSERMKASAYYITAFVATIVSSILSWITWGSVGPLTNLGFHDFFGVGFVYLFPAGMAMVFSRTLRPRPGMFSAHPKVSEYRPPNLGLLTVGIMTIFAGLPMIILSCLFFFDPGALAVSVTMADTSVGIAFNNYGAAWAGGALMGAVLAYSTRKFSYLLLGPLAGYVAGASGFDVYVPWQMFLVALGAPIVAYVIYEFLQRKQIDEHKLLPLFAGVGSYGLIMTGLLHIGVPRGGYLGIEEGAYAFQHGEIGVVMQLVGIVVSLGFGIITALVLSFVLKHTTGLDVSDDAQAEGLDKVYWDIEPDVDPVTDNKS
ncbi:MAG TPA: ammonium transporter [Methylophaga sp.]|jgi:ammonium transporter, Amt family|uniref:ammonium transporter n=1 Tax=unclassified Methylophaga TaxID=2629249 RepID=UPI000C96AA9D|nr:MULTISPECIES: ammonium transporter [unclassified Methylophaga]MAP27389.1 ammonium transporter [Methylophaga sp.]HAD30308.1 ammonium transporter [Methylophaga sp.]HCO00943.1 ammonium transporter [Methylophaga sp.]|tara:strand:+ start:796 stop:2163 length:1368 start_codon:yes stop_codon:yes gene_type:complete